MSIRSSLRVDLPDSDATEFPSAAENYVLWLRRYYDFRARWHRRFYRASGIVVIMSGAGLPVLVSLDYPAKDVVVSMIGMLVAAITALRAFYRWDQSWILLRKTETAITAAWWEYQGNIRADGGTDRNALAMALMQRVFDIRRHEAESFFKDLAFPTHAGFDGPAGPAQR